MLLFVLCLEICVEVAVDRISRISFNLSLHPPFTPIFFCVRSFRLLIAGFYCVGHRKPKMKKGLSQCPVILVERMYNIDHDAKRNFCLGAYGQSRAARRVSLVLLPVKGWAKRQMTFQTRWVDYLNEV